MSALTSFNHPFFGGLTIHKDEKGREYYRAIDVCSCLRLSNATVAIQRHVNPKHIFQFDDGTNRAGLTNYLSEPGVYQLIFKSKTDFAEQFQDWVFEEVLPKLRASGGYIMPTATSEQLGALIKDANAKLMSKYRMRSVKFKPDKDGTVKMTVFRNGGKEYETYISDKAKPSLVNPQILICGHYDDDVDCCNIDIDSPMKEAYVRWRQYDDVYDRRWKRDELEDWVRVNFPVAA